MSDKSAAVLPITPPSRLASPTVGSTAPPRIAPAEFGERLLRGREQKKRSLQEIAEATKISIHQLRALERGDLDRLPAGIYRRAIVRQYAEAVGLNVEEMLRDLAAIATEDDIGVQKPDVVAHASPDARFSQLAPALWSSAAALVVLGAAAAIAAVWYSTGTAAPAAPPVTAASVSTPEAEAPAGALVATTGAVGANESPTPTPMPAVTPTPSDRIDADDATEGELRITSEPSGALVTVNGVGWGPTPVTIRYMPFGKKVIRATKPGYVSAQRGFDFGADRSVRSIRMQLSPEATEAR